MRNDYDIENYHLSSNHLRTSHTWCIVPDLTNGALYFAMRSCEYIIYNSTTEKNPKTKRLKIEISHFITLADTALRRERILLMLTVRRSPLKIKRMVKRWKPSPIYYEEKLIHLANQLRSGQRL